MGSYPTEPGGRARRSGLRGRASLVPEPGTTSVRDRSKLQLSGVEGFLDFLRVGDLFGGVADEQRHRADDDGDRRHPQQSVGVALVQRVQLRAGSSV